MYPSLESWTLTELQGRLSLLNNVAVFAVVVVTLGGLFIGLWWDGYKDRINERIKQIETAEREKKDAALEAGVAEAKTRMPETMGLLAPGNGESPNITLPEGIPPPEMVVLLGEFAAVAHKFPYAVITQDGEPLVVLEKSDQGLSLSAKFFDKNGTIACEIENNRFQTHPQNVFKIKRTPHRLCSVSAQVRH